MFKYYLHTNVNLQAEQQISIFANSSDANGFEEIDPFKTVRASAVFGADFETNNHVIAGNKDVKVVLNDGKEYKFEVAGKCRVHDLALLKIDAKGLKPFTISPSRDIEIGNTVYAIGTPSSKSLS